MLGAVLRANAGTSPTPSPALIRPALGAGFVALADDPRREPACGEQPLEQAPDPVTVARRDPGFVDEFVDADDVSARERIHKRASA